MTTDHGAQRDQETRPARALPAVVARFVATESASAIVLVAAAVVALVWANSPWQDSYERLWHSGVTLAFGGFRVDHDLRHFVNDALMAVFFFVVGLEIKREVVHGELADRRVAALPVAAAVGGMVVPALVYVALAGGGEAGHGWGIPMATDIAFALGVLALIPRVPPSLKLFLLTLAIVDDVGAIVVIAAFYSDAIDTTALGFAAAGVAASVGLRRLRIEWSPVFLGLAVATWYATYQSGVHATIAGVALALTVPTRRSSPADTAERWADDLPEEPTDRERGAIAGIAGEGVSPAEHLEHALHPFTSFVVLPLFALANAGVELQNGMLDGPGATRVALGVAVGLVVGKPVGIVAGAWLAVRLGVARRPADTRWAHLAGAGAVGGIGFTVSLFVAGLAFTDPVLTDAAKVAILAASVTAALVGAAILRQTSPDPDR